ncbi:helix-turn-helix domain-containing protein [Burkholderia latens]|uniref:Helix-turn-helix domain-containing protein n=1 Tax=Burkholderia latens TaxID=488446 RepID=A0A6H9TEV2_9BURK|nr:helix-turn-helix domain-containing protein [Burkholderia latens]KAB0643355.1 helix-turn-helix domain-containing protein [Burkholderia latens]VWB65047.1 hypothetical protein BLA24064_03021 [Burkholderia latens]
MISLRNLSNPNLIGRRICELLDEEGMLTQAHLSLRFGVPRGTVSKYLKALTEEKYVYVASTISYSKQTPSKGMRRGEIQLYARTDKPLPVDQVERRELDATELHAIMASLVQRGK